MISITLNALIVFLHHVGEATPAVLVPVAAVVLLMCAFVCFSTPRRTKDTLFNREVY